MRSLVRPKQRAIVEQRIDVRDAASDVRSIIRERLYPQWAYEKVLGHRRMQKESEQIRRGKKSNGVGWTLVESDSNARGVGFELYFQECAIDSTATTMLTLPS